MNSTPIVSQLINGEFQTSDSHIQLAITNPATQEIIAKVPSSTTEEVTRAITSAKAAFQEWKEVPAPERSRLMMRFQALLKKHHNELAKLLSQETGKLYEDAKGDVWRGIEVVEQAANIAPLLMGETVENVAKNIDSYSLVQPLGVCAGITPFNFPAMIPLWMFPMAIASGNTFVLKPSEQDPLTPMRLAELFQEAGAPPGVLQVVHGQKEQVELILKHPDIKAISFVGSVAAGKHIYRTATYELKRCQAFVGAKNHMVIMPDANKEQVINNLIGAGFGAAGQRCMAISVAVFVGKAKEWIPDLKEAISNIQPGPWDDDKAIYGPQISQQAKENILRLIQQGKDEGASCLLDGSNCQVDGFPNGNWVGPTLFSDVTRDMSVYQQEIFGPVLCCMEVDSLDSAITLINDNPYGNGTSIFTDSGHAARKFQHEIEVGQVGINIAIPVPLPFFSFTGWGKSFYGDLHAYGKQAIRFYTETKTLTSRWFDTDSKASAINSSIKLK